MIVKFNKKQIKALASIRSKAEAYFNEFQAEKPYLYKEEDRERTIRCFAEGILDYIIENGEAYIEDEV